MRDPEAPAGERVKILDFGLAKIAQSSDAGGAPHRTTTGMIMGTPLYMSPEQCRGLAYADDKTDVYSLGILLFEMLAGQPPFVADTAGDLIAMHIAQSPPPLRRLVPTASAAVAALVADMLKKDPAARPSMAQVAARLQAVSAAPPRSVPTVPRWLLGAAAVLVVLTAVLIGRSLREPPVPPRRPLPEIAGQGRTGGAVPPDPPPSRTVWSLTSEPAGAALVRSTDRAQLGQTPWRSEQDPQPGRVTVLVSLPGHASQEISLDGDVSVSRHVVLQPLAEPPPAPLTASGPGLSTLPATLPTAQPEPQAPGKAGRPAGKGRGARAGTAKPATAEAPVAAPADNTAKPPAPPPRPRPEPTPEDVDVPALH